MGKLGKRPPMEKILEKAIYEGIDIDLNFISEKPKFGDLFLICGDTHPNYPPSGKFQFEELAHLNFKQIDDYFGKMESKTDIGAEIIWLYPLVGDKCVYHHPGPFTGLRLSYSILRNPAEYTTLFLEIVLQFTQYLDVDCVYRLRQLSLGQPPQIAIIENDINQVVKYWEGRGIVPGYEKALSISY